MNLPKKWSVLDINTEDSDKYLFGVDYSKNSYHYSLYLTDLTNVWICDVDENKLELKALQNGIEAESLSNIYQILIASFENNFNSENTRTFLNLSKSKLDRGVPLEMKLNLTKIYNEGAKLNWSFDFIIIPDSSAISILKNLIFHLSTVAFSLNEYKNDLFKQIAIKDTAINYLKESLENMDGEHIIAKWAPENSTNARTLKQFDSNLFDKVWKEKRLVRFENKYIWEVLELNTTNDTWNYGVNFTEESNHIPLLKDKKRTLDNEEDEFLPSDKIEERERSESPMKKRRTTVQTLTNDFEVYDLKKESSEEPSVNNTSRETSKSPPIPSSPVTKSETTEPVMQEAKNPEQKRKRGFGVSRKRKVAYSTFSPIKAAKHFQSDD